MKHTHTLCLVWRAAFKDQHVLLSNEDFEPTDRPAGLWEIILSTHVVASEPSWTHTLT